MRAHPLAQANASTAEAPSRRVDRVVDTASSVLPQPNPLASLHSGLSAERRGARDGPQGQGMQFVAAVFHTCNAVARSVTGSFRGPHACPFRELSRVRSRA